MIKFYRFVAKKVRPINEDLPDKVEQLFRESQIYCDSELDAQVSEIIRTNFLLGKGTLKVKVFISLKKTHFLALRKAKKGLGQANVS